MKSKKKYSNDASFARLPHQENPCYRTLIIYPLYQFFLSQHSKEKTIEKFEEMLEAFNKRELFILKNYLELYPVNMNPSGNDIGYFIVDKTDSFPILVIYPYSTSSYCSKPNKSRMSALIEAMRDLACSRRKIIDAYEYAKDWYELQEILKTIFKFKNAS
jgi:hypothetical protein